MEEIIKPIDKDILSKELNSDRFLRTTRKGGNEIYWVNIHNAPERFERNWTIASKLLFVPRAEEQDYH